MTYAVIGGGNTGQAISAYLSLNGEQVRLFTRNQNRAKRISEHGLEVKGIYSGHVDFEVSTSIEKVVKNAEYIVISTTAVGHKPILRALKPLLEHNQSIIFIPGYWGALEAAQILKEDVADKNITIAETSAQPFISKKDDQGSVTIPKIKNNVLVSTLVTQNRQPELSPEFLDRFPHLVTSTNIFETSLNNSNVVVHVPISIFNGSRIDSAQPFEFYPEGVSPLTVKYIEKLDEERRKIADLFHVKTKDILTILNNFYDTNYTNLHDALPGLFASGAGPTTVEHRYFTEDIPFGLVAISEIAKKSDIKLPYTDSLINTSSLFSGEDYRNTGVNLDNISFNELFSFGGITERI
ncbi:NAD/NADP-dependent octopine/nopaline dehydrogenase family protein [Salinicoccus carnicancri]|uniref:NAD/NADP-dependent octopine/nopaline dehydrogenase family protein n=1 Tax=Salinicoccus carnicancri TaxID=558170 RepID=UPI00030639D1|nr:NAD/NADP-dependent octopine/nopaline dehydrogenase family protein [Salinicoccus carnicancri]